jgi:O-antigen/teichoic acid export membrane protein
MILRWQALYAIPVATMIATLATPMIVVLYSETWREAGGVMAAIAVVSGINCIVFPFGDVLKAIGRQRVLVGLTLIELPILIVAIVLAAPEGIVTVAWVRSASVALYALTVIAFVMRAARIRPGSMLSAARPGVVTGLGVLAGAGAVRLLVEPEWLILLAGLTAGAAGGAVGMRLGAPSAFHELTSQLARVRDRVRGRGGDPAEERAADAIAAAAPERSTPDDPAYTGPP